MNKHVCILLLLLVGCNSNKDNIEATIMQSQFLPSNKYSSDSYNSTIYKILVENNTKNSILINWSWNHLFDESTHETIKVYNVEGGYSIISPSNSKIVYVRRNNFFSTTFAEQDTHHLEIRFVI